VNIDTSTPPFFPPNCGSIYPIAFFMGGVTHEADADGPLWVLDGQNGAVRIAVVAEDNSIASHKTRVP
jgi:hypothetical protein